VVRPLNHREKIKPPAEGIVQSQVRHPQLHTTYRAPYNPLAVVLQAIHCLHAHSLSIEPGIDSHGHGAAVEDVIDLVEYQGSQIT